MNGLGPVGDWLREYLAEIHIYVGVALLGWGTTRVAGWFVGTWAGVGAGVLVGGGLLVLIGLFLIE